MSSRIVWQSNKLPPGDYKLRVQIVRYGKRTAEVDAIVAGRGKYSGLKVQGSFDVPAEGEIAPMHVMSDKQKKQKLARDKRNAAKKAKKVAVKKKVVRKRIVTKPRGTHPEADHTSLADGAAPDPA